MDLVIPPQHKVYTVQEAKFLKIPLAYPYEMDKRTEENAEIMTQFPLDGLHFYCESFDLTYVFISKLTTVALSHLSTQFMNQMKSLYGIPFYQNHLQSWGYNDGVLYCYKV